MSAPVTDRPRVRTAPATTRTRPAIPAQRDAGRDTAAKRAYARRDERLRRITGGPRPERTAEPTRRAQFAMLVMGLLVTGLVLTLWLSTAAAADSYRLQDARHQAGMLTEQAERLHRQVAAAGSATEIARRAAELGMVPVQDPARLVVGPDGAVTVLGDPFVVRAPAPPPAPAPAAPVPGAPGAPGAPVDGAPPAGGTPPVDGTLPADGTTPVEDVAPVDGTAPVDPAPVDPALADPALADPALADPVADPAADPAAGATAGPAATASQN